MLRKLQANLGRAEGQLKRAQTRYDDLRERWTRAPQAARVGLERQGHQAKLELRDAESRVAHARRELGAEEQRLIRPDTFLRFS